MNKKKLLRIFFWVICIELCLQSVSIFLSHTYGGHFANSPKNLIPYVGYLFDFYGPPTPEQLKGIRPQDRTLAGRLSQAKKYEAGAPAMWLFGGSVLNGGYSRNMAKKGNIPDLLAQKLAQGGYHYNVFDLGAGSYSIQLERMLFFEMLRRYPHPKIVIFYDCYNEFSTPSNRIGYAPEYPSLKALHYDLFDTHRFIEDFTMHRFKSLFLFEAIINLHTNKRLNDKDPFALDLRPHESPVSAKVHNYLYNVSLIKAVCRAYKITPVFITHPVLQTKTFLSSTEQNIPTRNEAQTDDLKTFYTQVRAAMKGDFLDLSGIFSNCKHTIYIDHCRIIDESGNGHHMIVNSIYTYMIKKHILTR